MTKQSHASHEHDKAHSDPRPYWKRAHRDWRFWGAVLLMLACMIMYLWSNDLAGRPRTQPSPPAAPGM